jgi:hypothetical protein
MKRGDVSCDQGRKDFRTINAVIAGGKTAQNIEVASPSSLIVGVAV